MKKILSTVILSSSLIGGLAHSEEIKFPEGESVSILTAGYVEDVAMHHLLDILLTEKGVKFKSTLLDLGPLYATLSKGDADLFVDSWLPHTHGHYWDKFKDKIEKIGVTYDDALSGLVVPKYVDIDSIEELNEHVDEFDGKIIGIDSGAGIHKQTREAIDAYDLDYTQITSSEGAMLASLRKAVSKEQPIIITGWQPHYKWDLYDLKRLDDPKTVYEKDQSVVIARKDFKKDKPELAAFFENFNFDIEEVNELVALVREAEKAGDDPKEGAQKFYDEHRDMIDAWFEK